MHETEFFQNLAFIMGLATILNILLKFLSKSPLKQSIVTIFESLFNAACVIDKSCNSLCQFAKYFMQYDLDSCCLAYKLSQIIKSTFSLITIFLMQIRLNNVSKTDRKSTILRQLKQTQCFYRK